MTDGFTNRPKILRGAFVELGLSLPPPVVAFQFNPVQVTRNRTISHDVPGRGRGQSPRQVHSRPEYANLFTLAKHQLVTVQEQAIGFDLRLDATDRLDDQDGLSQQFGIAPQLATLEQMVLPKDESQFATLFGKVRGFSFTRGANPPMVLFVFGRKRVLPVNITTMNITETDFSAELNPVRATVKVGLSVIEGGNLPYRYTKAAAEVMSALNLARIADLKHVVVPG
jgi:hypothetical protein